MTDVQKILDQIPDQKTATYLIYLMEDRFGITAVYWTREEMEMYYGRPLTDDEWSQIRESKAWREAWWMAEESTPGALMDMLIAEGIWPPVGDGDLDATKSTGDDIDRDPTRR